MRKNIARKIFLMGNIFPCHHGKITKIPLKPPIARYFSTLTTGTLIAVFNKAGLFFAHLGSMACLSNA